VNAAEIVQLSVLVGVVHWSACFYFVSRTAFLEEVLKNLDEQSLARMRECKTNVY
jgi:hypothetical protein